jgi:protein-S-isoprenylcysteine O-methyltransferase Ste14
MNYPDIIISLCVSVILISVLVNFIEGQPRKTKVKQEKKSIVETGSMIGFFLFFCLLIMSKLGLYEVSDLMLKTSLVISGLVVIVFSTLFNVWGRFFLGKNWGNQIKIYEDHTLVMKGPFRFVRHPLYASLIWMFYGASLVYFSWTAFLATSFIFVPFMYYRAKQEEGMLKKSFLDYQRYIKNVGMFFPKLKIFCSDSKPVTVPNAAFVFCRYSIALMLLAAVLFKIKWLLIVVFVVFVLSVILKVKRAPMILLYRYTIGLLWKSKGVTLDEYAMRFAHGLGVVFSAICLLFLYFVNENVGWGLTVAFLVIKLISAFGFCPASKFYKCVGSGGGCCAFTKRNK